MNLKLNNIKNMLEESIQKTLSKEHFRYNEKRDEFVRKDKFGNFQVITLFFYDYKSNVQVEIKVSIKIKVIEDIYYDIVKENGTLYDDIKTLTANIGAIIAYKDKGIMVGGPNRTKIVYLIENEDDAKLLSDVIPKRINEYVLPYFEENTSVQRVDYLLNNDINSISIHHFNLPSRACIGVIAAKLNNNPKMFQVVNNYRERLQAVKENFRNQFENVVLEIKK
jgi:hypothetical protein